MKHLLITTKERLLATVLLSSFFFLIFTLPAYAGVVRVLTDVSKLHVGDVFTVAVVVDTESESLNAVETTVVFPADLFEFVSSNSGNSVITVWLRDTSENSEGSIIFSGITPGGFTQDDARIIELTFKVLKEGQGIIETKNTELLLHDGLGTPAAVKTENVHVSIVEGESLLSVNTVDDEDPEDFTPTITSDPDVFNGEHFMTFATKDKGSGVHHFEVKEGLFGRYAVAKSPYRLLHQSQDVKIYVKAIDNNNNERTVIVYPQNKEPWHQNKNVIAGILIVCVLTPLTFLLFTRKRLRS
jgi:hypothetical protein